MRISAGMVERERPLEPLSHRRQPAHLYWHSVLPRRDSEASELPRAMSRLSCLQPLNIELRLGDTAAHSFSHAVIAGNTIACQGDVSV